MHGSGSEFLGKMEKRYKEFSMEKSEVVSLRLRVEVSISDAKGSIWVTATTRRPGANVIKIPQ
jgi:hypothetical protein